MKILRSSKCSLKFADKSKLGTLKVVLREYSTVVNFFITRFWDSDLPSKSKLLKDVVNLPTTWLSARMRKVAAREAVDMILSSKKRWGDKAKKPVHRGKKMSVSSIIAELQIPKRADEFDCWLHLASIGNGVILNLPIRKHKQFLKWEQRGTRLNSYVITEKDVQFSFEVETGPKKENGDPVGIDTGINVLASLSTGEQLGTDMKENVERIKRCKHGSKGQKRARRALKQRMDEVAKEITLRKSIKLIVVEKLKNLNHKTKERRRLSRNIRRSVGSWAWRYWLDRLQMDTEENRVSFRSVPAYNTSITCPICGHINKKNRLSQECFLCQKCGHTGNADFIAAGNILNRFLTGPYGACCKPSTSAQVDLSRL